MNKPDPIAQTRTHDAGLNALLELGLTSSDSLAMATAAVLMNRGLLPVEEIRDMFARVRATSFASRSTPEAPSTPA